MLTNHWITREGSMDPPISWVFNHSKPDQEKMVTQPTVVLAAWVGTTWYSKKHHSCRGYIRSDEGLAIPKPIWKWFTRWIIHDYPTLPLLSRINPCHPMVISCYIPLSKPVTGIPFKADWLCHWHWWRVPVSWHEKMGSIWDSYALVFLGTFNPEPPMF